MAKTSKPLKKSRVKLPEYATAVAATVREPFLVLDGKLRVIAANASFYQAFRLTCERVENVPLFEIGGGEWNIPKLKAWLEDKNDSFLEGLEIEHSRKHLRINARRIRSPRMVLVAIEDVTLETTLRETQASFSAFRRQAPVGVLQAGREGDCNYINAHASRMIGLEMGDALGRGWISRVHADDISLFLAKERQASVSKEGFSTELRFVHETNRVTWALLILIPLTAPNGKFSGYLATITDITDRKELEERLAQAQKMEAIGRLAGGVAHDFNNMLTAISSYTAQLLSCAGEDDPLHKPARQINKIVDQASRLTRQLLAFSRKQLLRPTRVDLNQIVRDMYELLVRLLGDSIEIVVAAHPEEQIVVVDVGQLQQVILNVAINARDAMPNGGRVTFRTAQVRVTGDQDGLLPGAYVVLSVSDTGSGMDRETRERLFEPFYTTKPPGAGTGLGLSMVYGIVRQSGGNITVESEPGKGTTFHIYLPKEPGSAEAPIVPAASVDGTGTETILVVEDAAVVRSLIRELLEQRGYTVMEASDALEAIALAENHDGPIDLLLTDLVMPRIGGHELAKRLRQRRPGLRVIYMSGYSGDALHAVEKEANFLEKPFKPDVLAGFIRRVLGAPKTA